MHKGEPAKLAVADADQKAYVRRYREIYDALCKVSNMEFAERGPRIYYEDAVGYVLITREPQDACDAASEDDRAGQELTTRKRLRRVGGGRS